LVAADVNQDGNPDLIASVASNSYPTTVMVFLNDGTGHFPKGTTYNVDGSGGLAVGDFEGNGALDIAASYPNVGDFSILLNKGDGTFRLGKTFDLGGSDLVAGEFRSKKKGHKLDLVVALGSHVALLPGNGDGTFQDNLVQNGPNGQFGFGTAQSGDFNGDHKLDLITDLGVLLGRGDRTFGSPIPLPKGCFPGQGFALGDFNHDNKLDIAVARNPGGGVNVCLGNGDGTFQKPVVSDRGIPHGLVQAGDFNNDGKLDLAASDTGGISILLGNGDGTFQSGIPTALNSFGIFRLGDFNGDGKLDVAATINSGIAVLPGKGDGTFGSPIISTDSSGAVSLEVGDLNNDGKLDLVTDRSVLLGNGDGSFKSPISYPGVGGPIVLGDFNGDGKLDVAAVTRTLAATLVFFGKGDGTLTGPVLFDTWPGNAITAGDFTGDGDLDLLLLQDRGLEVLLNAK
jgi:hypothetical protein